LSPGAVTRNNKTGSVRYVQLDIEALS